ncbi:MAG: tRNA (adenosine(37)-N6)-threonylcarbamoyltransferase complex ATPase subunit type 1 TsaE [Oscillospiraceae bacterium]
MPLIMTTHTPQETEMVGEALSLRLDAGDIVALEGELGAGKTVFVRGLARGLGCADEVSSPTFALINEYRGGRCPLCHMDAYRLACADDLIDTGYFDYADGGWICIVEWSERVAAALSPSYVIRITRIDDATRQIEMKGRGL